MQKNLLTCIWDAGWFPSTWRSHWPWWRVECRGPHTPPYWWKTTTIHLYLWLTQQHEPWAGRSTAFGQPLQLCVCVKTGWRWGLGGRPVRCEHHRSAVLDDAHDGVPEEASRVGIHPCRGLVLRKHKSTRGNFTLSARLQMNANQILISDGIQQNISNLCQFESDSTLGQPMCERCKARLDWTHMASHLDPVSLINPCIKRTSQSQSAITLCRSWIAEIAILKYLLFPKQECNAVAGLYF